VSTGFRPSDLIGAFFIAGLAMMGAGVAAALVQSADPWARGDWLALHLVVVGGISQLVLGASQFFAGAALATEPPPRRLIREQLVGWNAGTLLVAVGVPLEIRVLVFSGAALLTGTLAAYAAGLLGMHRRSLATKPWASRWYLAGASCLTVGLLAGVGLATGAPWSHGNLLAAHMVLNLGGWFGTAIVGTLHTFYPSLTGSRLRHPRLQLPALAAWSSGIVALCLGYAFSLEALALGGWVLLAGAAGMLSANLVGSLRFATRSLSLAAKLVGAAQLFLPAGLLLAVVSSLEAGALQAITGSTRDALGVLLLAGWIGLTVCGSLLHLLAVLIGPRGLAARVPRARSHGDSAFTTAAVAGVISLAAARVADAGALGQLPEILVFIVYAVLGGRIAYLAARLMKDARPKI
jgi:nitrite reductase (NO-forming)